MAKKNTPVSVEEKPSTDTLAYEGNVTLKLQKGKRIVQTINTKNTATMRMFEGIAYMLINGFSIDLEPFTPHYLAVAYHPTDLLVETDVTATDLQDGGIRNAVTARLTSSNIFQSGSSWVAPFSAVITSQALSSTNGLVNELGLFATNNSSTMLARIILQNPIEVQAGMNLIVEWNVYIQNK